MTSQWYKKGSCPKVRSYPGRVSVAYSGFVIPRTGQLFVTKPERFTYETVIDSIRQFIDTLSFGSDKKVYLFMDNATWHTKAKRLIETDKDYEDIRSKIVIESIPPYSPDLNPIEQVWRVTRREKTHNRYFSGLPTLTSILDKWFTGFSVPNEKLLKLCSFNW